ncbi:helix-turn-helix domain-containing protein [Streptomyces sp. NPDC101455]|uniref:helix-turn-helix domain-containing protein n=1 Tax=Streptomyces sp. NPDC101455 TaxID=3366142 RepID=UPI00381EC9B9
MDYQRGIVLYDLAGTAERLNVSRATVKRHVKVLRELGALVWLEHGSRRNLHLPGRAYTATATIYSATIPQAYDQALGHRVTGSGYTARCTGFTPEGRLQAIAAAQASAVPPRREPPSRAPTPHHPEADVNRTATTTRRTRAKTPTPKKKSLLGRSVTTAAFRAADRLARQLRPLHRWLQRSRIAELSWVLLDKAASGATLAQVDAWLHEINPVHYYGPSWRPVRPHAYVAALLIRDAADAAATAQHLHDERHATAPTQVFHDAAQTLRSTSSSSAELTHVKTLDDVDDVLRLKMRSEAWRAFAYARDTSLVLAAVEGLGIPAASRLYTAPLVDACVRVHANLRLSVNR